MLFRAGVKLTRCCFFSAANYHQNATTRRTLPTKWMTRRKHVVVLPGRSVSCSASSSEAEKAQNDVTMSKLQEVWKASIDFKSIRENQSHVETNCLNRNVTNVSVQFVVSQYEAFVALDQKADLLRASRNENAKKMKGKMEKVIRDELIEEGKRIKDELALIEVELNDISDALQREAQKIPNDTHPDVPIGGEEFATVMEVVGTQRDFGTMKCRDHVTIGETLNMFDFETASRVSGTRFVYLTGVGAMLELALINWAMQKAISKGFEPMVVPDLVRKSVVEKCGFQPRAENTQVYSVENSDLCLAGTAELLLGGKCMDQTYEEKDLPKKFVAFSHCFRTEAGAAGAATRGMYRLHQFSKVEMFAVSTPEASNAMHEELSNIEKEMYAELGLHFKVLDMSSHDLGAPAYRKLDIEAWMPALERYGEISSASNCTDFQARRLNIKYRPNAVDGKKQPLQFAHTLNATACAVPRMIICILENFQNEDGSVTVPEALRPFLGGMEVFRNPAAI